MNQWFSPKDLLHFMQNKKNRRLVWRDCLAYCEPSKEPVTFTSNFIGKIATKIGTNVFRKNYSWIDPLFIPNGHPRPLSELPTTEYLEFWSQNMSRGSWKKLVRHLKARN